MNDKNQSLVQEVVATIDMFLDGATDIEQVEHVLAANEHLLDRDATDVDVVVMREAESDLGLIRSTVAGSEQREAAARRLRELRVVLEHPTREPRYRAMAKWVIADYRSQVISLKRLVDDLENISLGFDASEWSREFEQHWGTLEEIYAVALDRESLADMPSDMHKDLDDAIGALEALLADP